MHKVEDADRQWMLPIAEVQVVETSATDIAYLCGNPDMVDATSEALKEAGLPTPQVRREKYVSSK